MASNTLQIALPEPLKAFVDERVAEGEYGTPSDYIGSLIRQDRERYREHLESQLIEALDSGYIEIDAKELDERDLVAILRDRVAADAP